MAKNNLNRENRLKQHLEREFQVDRPPESYFQAVQNALDSLPDELPVKRRPLPQRMLRRFAACAACLVLLAAGAYGLNLAAPSLMESMPGIGQIFQELNHHEELPPTPTPPPPPDAPQPRPGGQDHHPPGPELHPGGGLSPDNSCMLSVVNARCDGIYLTLDLELEIWDPAMADSTPLSTCSNFSMEHNTSTLFVNEEAAEPLELPEQTCLSFSESESKPGDPSTLTASWSYRLPQKLSGLPHGEPLSFSLELPELHGFDQQSSSITLFPCQITALFQGAVDLRNTFTYSETVEDNSVALEGVEVTSQAVIAQMSSPYFGTLNSTLMVPVENQHNDSLIPLGSYPVLTTQDGQQLESNDFPLEETTERITSGIFNTSRTQQGAFTFDPPPADATQLILTLYEYPQVYGEPRENPQKNRVTAEFTIDLERGTVYPSQNYMAQGREKLDHTQSASMDRTPTLVNGYICGLPEKFGNDYMQIPLYSKDLAYRPDRPVSLQCYLGDELWNTYSSVNETQYNAKSEDESYFYQEGVYRYFHQPLPEPDITGSGPYQVTLFQIEDLPDGHNLSPEDLHFSLVDQNTGEVLVEDVVQAYYRACDEVFGTTMEKSLYLENQEPSDGDSGWESQSSFPEASPNPTWF